MSDARRIAGEIRSAESRGYNLYWQSSDSISRRVIKARMVKGKISLYTLPDGKWHEVNYYPYLDTR